MKLYLTPAACESSVLPSKFSTILCRDKFIDKRELVITEMEDTTAQLERVGAKHQIQNKKLLCDSKKSLNMACCL